MKVFGQRSLMVEVDFLLQDMLAGKNHNLLLRAPSGHGKTSVALNLLWWLGWDKAGEYILCTKEEFLIDRDKRVHVLDEAHLIDHPEFLYPLMDSGNYIFILCTNLSGDLTEPLRNRCIQFIFQPYTQEEMEEMVAENLSQFHLCPEKITLIAQISRNNPRNCKIICERLAVVFRWKGVPNDLGELTNIIENILQIQTGGFNQQDEIYLDFLKKAQVASLDTISAATGLDKNTIKYEVEPFLIHKGLVQISSRGRKIV